MDRADLLTVSEVANPSGFAPSGDPVYEKQGLIQALRTAGGQRRFERNMLRRLAFIGAARNVGLTLEEVAAALADVARQTHTDPRRLDPAVEGLARAPGRPDRGADRAARQPGFLHRLRLPIAEAVRDL